MIRMRELAVEQTNINSCDIKFKLYELLHNVAFRESLGNPLLAPPEQISHIKRSTVTNFRSKHFVPGKMAFVGLGINHEDLQHVVSNTIITDTGSSSATTSNTPSVYYGGQAHIFQPPSVPSDMLLAFPTAKYSPKSYATSKVCVELIGTLPIIEYASTRIMPTNIDTSAYSPNVSATASLVQYSDAGLIVIHFHGNPSLISTYSKKLYKTISNYTQSVSPNDLKRAKVSAIISHEKTISNGQDFCLETANSLMSLGNALPPKEMYSLINEVNAEDIKKFLKSALSHKLSLVYTGSPSSMPNLDEFTLRG